MSTRLNSMLSSGRLIFSGPTFKSFIHFELIFASGIRWGYSFIFVCVPVQLSQHRLLKRLTPPLYIVGSFVINEMIIYVWGVISGLSILLHCSLCLFRPMPQLVTQFKSESVMPSALFFFLKDPYSGSFVAPHKLQDGFSISVKNLIGILIGIALIVQTS